MGYKYLLVGHTDRTTAHRIWDQVVKSNRNWDERHGLKQHYNLKLWCVSLRKCVPARLHVGRVEPVGKPVTSDPHHVSLVMMMMVDSKKIRWVWAM